ncbi:MAG: hypothetical protein ACOC2C_06565 [Cyclonatronaceae bacterium]
MMASWPQRAQAQNARLYENIYRPPASLSELNTPHFRLIFPQQETPAARRAARILEAQYPIVQHLVGGELRRFPVVLNAHNDRGNGFVTTLHFRSEIELPPLKGSALNPRTGGWMENVAPHELVHALHFSHLPAYSLPGITRLFAPDIARSFHGAAPAGMLEGIAVFHESQVVYGSGGRGNYALFRNQSRANLSTPAARPWSLAQHLMPSFYSFPGNRHYTAGHEFISWLQYRHGMDSTRESIRFFVKYPFLGYGSALRKATGKWPAALYEAYLSDTQAAIEAQYTEPEHLAFTDPAARLMPLPPGADAAEQHAPQWLDAQRIIYAQHTQYTQRPGFYVSELDETGRPGPGTLLYETTQIGDFMYDVMPADSTRPARVLYGRYHQHPYRADAATAELHELQLDSRTAERLTHNGRMNAPAWRTDGSIIALRPLHETLQPVLLHEDGSSETLPDIYPDSFVQISPSPSSAHQYAVIANRNGLQALWLIESEAADFSEISTRDPDIGFKEGLVHQLSWHPGGRHLLISATRQNAPQIYEYSIDEGRLIQLTHQRFGAWHGSYRPETEDRSGADAITNDISFITQQGNSRRLGLLKREDMVARSFLSVDFRPKTEAMETAFNEENRLSSYLNDEIEALPITPYRSGVSWLKPRAVLPFVEESGLVQTTRYGLQLQGGDLLRRHSWQSALSYANARFWAEGSYRYSGFYPGFITEAFYRPRESSLGLLAERGASLQIPLSWRLDERSRSSFWQFRPGISLRELRPERIFENGRLRDTQNGEFEWLTDLSLDARLAFYHRLQQNRRDIQPNSGRIFFAQAERYLYSDREAEVTGLRAGITQYLSPSLRHNHGLRIGAEVLTQSRTRLFGTSGLVYEGFSQNVLAGARNALSLRARYVLPLGYVDDGYITLPVFLDRLYLSLNANYVADINTLEAPFSAEDAITKGRTIYGLELRANLRFFNLPLDVGLGLGYEPTRRAMSVFGNAR